MDIRVMARPAHVLSGMAQAEGYKNPVVLRKCSDRSQCLGVSTGSEKQEIENPMQSSKPKSQGI